MFKKECTGECPRHKGKWQRIYKRLASGLLQLQVIGQRSDLNNTFSGIMIDDLKLQKCTDFSKYCKMFKLLLEKYFIMKCLVLAIISVILYCIMMQT